MTIKEKEKLEVFHLRCIRRILGIKWSDVMDLHITNGQINFFKIILEISNAK